MCWWHSFYGLILQAEYIFSCLVDRAPWTALVVQDDNRSLNLFEMCRVSIQELERVACQILKCFCDLPIGLPNLPHGCVATRENMKYWQPSWCQLSEACADGIDAVESVILAYAKSHPDISQRSRQSQITVCSNKDGNDICVHSTHLYNLLTLVSASS